ncbi:MAG TPA: hypothetical protein VIM41_15855 [Gammaproteobacteria bacterium]
MKNSFIALVVTLIVSASAIADEKIQLAAAIGSGAAVQPTVEATGASAGAGTAAGATTAAAGTMSTGTMIAVGVIAAAGLAAIANSGSSSSH